MFKMDFLTTTKSLKLMGQFFFKNKQGRLLLIEAQLWAYIQEYKKIKNEKDRNINKKVERDS